MKRWLPRLTAACTAFVASMSFAANVVVFTDTSFVDYNPGDTDAEASNVINSLTALGHTAVPFTGSTAAAWTSALSGQRILILPEFENREPADLDSGVATVVQNFVSGGGHVIVMGGGEALEALFSWGSFSGSSEAASAATPQKPGSIFGAGPATLPEMNATVGLMRNELPAGGICAYNFMVSTDEYCTVFTRTQGSGRVSYLAWDWFFDSDETASRPDWEGVLGLAIQGGPAPVARPVPVPTTGATELAALAGLLMLGGAAALRRRHR